MTEVVHPVQEHPGGRNVIHQYGKVCGVEILVADDVGRARPGQLSIRGLLPKVGAYDGTVAVTAKVKTQDCVTMVLQFDGQRVPAFLLASGADSV